MLRKLLAVSLALASFPAFAQSPPPPPPPPPPASVQPPPPPPPVSQPASRPPAYAEKTEKSESSSGGSSAAASGIAFEFAIGPASFSNPNTSGVGYQAAVRFLKHTGLRTDFGLVFQHTSFDQNLVFNKTAVHNIQGANGGSLELLIGFGAGPIEIMGGGGLGLTWVNSKLDPFNQALSIDRSEVGVASYGLEIAAHLPVVRPVFRLWRLGDLGTKGDTGSVSSVLFLFGLGLEVPTS